jgi:hypothetical protein
MRTEERAVKKKEERIRHAADLNILINAKQRRMRKYLQALDAHVMTTQLISVIHAARAQFLFRPIPLCSQMRTRGVGFAAQT